MIFFNILEKMAKLVAAITGGSKGIGKACVERFLADGYEVKEFLEKCVEKCLGKIL